MTTSARPRIALFGLFGVGNLGNEASLRAGLEAVRRQRPDATPVVVCTRPDVVRAEHHVEAAPIAAAGATERLRGGPRPVRLALRPIVELGRWLSAWRFARTVEGFVVPGTGILDDFGVAPHQMPYDLFRWSTASRLARRPWTMVGVGAGPIEHRASRWLILRTVRNAGLVTYRDEGSRAFMAELGAPSPPETVQPDVAFALGPPAPRATPGGEIGLGVMTYYGWHNDATAGQATFAHYLDNIAAIAAGLIGAGYRVRLLTGAAGDTVAVEHLNQRLADGVGRAGSDQVVHEPVASFADLLDQVANTEAVVATRYHNVIAALMFARPTVAIGYAGKFRDLMQSVGLGSHCHDADRFDAATVLADLDEVLAQADHIVHRLEQVNRRYSRDAAAGFAAAIALVGQRPANDGDRPTRALTGTQRTSRRQADGTVER